MVFAIDVTRQRTIMHLSIRDASYAQACQQSRAAISGMEREEMDKSVPVMLKMELYQTGRALSSDPSSLRPIFQA